eukprot:TRINITY_DN9897_c0_g1_i1.p1 TRINITY_DN9897_c0_g1~~TRINITY_DN9897_c0_g1_i1.p1  ORF type:complete len:123 (+),score=12.44 TRINITY_DN9897_c0_g1_i1:241-609(+)
MATFAVVIALAILTLGIVMQEAAGEYSLGMDAIAWPSKFAGSNKDLVEPNVFDDDEDLMESHSARRVLAAQPVFVSYGALSADRVVCPPRSGRSYYTPNCYVASQPRVYSRGCPTYTRCARV